MTVGYLTFGDRIQIADKVYWNLSHPDVLNLRPLINKALPRAGLMWSLFQDPINYFGAKNYSSKPLLSVEARLSKKLNANVYLFLGFLSRLCKALLETFELKTLNACVWADIFSFTDVSLIRSFRRDQKSLRIFIDQFDDQSFLQGSITFPKVGLDCLDCTFSLVDLLDFGVSEEIYQKFDLVLGSFLLLGLPEIFFIASKLGLPSGLINNFMKPPIGYCYAIELALENVGLLRERSLKNFWLMGTATKGLLKNDYVSVLKADWKKLKFLSDWLKEKSFFALVEKGRGEDEGVAVFFRNQAMNKLLSCSRLGLDFKEILDRC